MTRFPAHPFGSITLFVLFTSISTGGTIASVTVSGTTAAGTTVSSETVTGTNSASATWDSGYTLTYAAALAYVNNGLYASPIDPFPIQPALVPYWIPNILLETAANVGIPVSPDPDSDFVCEDPYVLSTCTLKVIPTATARASRASK